MMTAFMLMKVLSHKRGRCPIISLASHTLQSQEKEGLVTSRTTSCSGDRIWSRPIRFEILITHRKEPKRRLLHAGKAIDELHSAGET